jgi:hypothetical protein
MARAIATDRALQELRPVNPGELCVSWRLFNRVAATGSLPGSTDAYLS